MMILEYLRNQLLTDGDVSAIAGTNVFCTNPPQDVTGAYVVITQISSNGFDAVEWKACRSSFKSFPRGYAQDLMVRSIGQHTGPLTDSFNPIDGSDLHIYRTMQDFNVCFSFT